MIDSLDVFVGWEPREALGFEVFSHSARRRTDKLVHIVPLMLRSLRFNDLYWRKHESRNGQMWDVISGAPMSTEFAISRFLVPRLQREGWCLFAEPDMLVRNDLSKLFAMADDRYAVMCVKHEYVPEERRKMDNQMQVPYARKNWSSLMLINASHPSNKRLTVDMVNELPGRDLHRFCWLAEDEIGALPLTWNYLVGVNHERIRPKILHYTLGTPEVAPEQIRFAKAWKDEAALVRRPLPSEWKEYA